MIGRSGRASGFVGIAAAVVSLLSAGAVALAQATEPFSAEAQIADARVYVGTPTTLQIVLSGARSPDPPVVPEIDGARIDYTGGRDVSSHSVMIVNGVRSESHAFRFIYSYSVTPTRPGTIIIPAITARDRASGSDASTRPMKLEAVEPAETENYKLRLHVEKTQAYVGEPVNVRLIWYLAKSVADAPVVSGSRPDGAGLHTPSWAPRPERGRSDHIPMSFLGEASVATRSESELDGERFATFTIEKVLVPDRAGRISVGPFYAMFDEVVGERPRRFGEAPWENRTITERRVIPSNAATITVRPLPTEGRPADFSGLVGNVRLHATATPREVNVGDPIDLTLNIQPGEPVSRVGLFDPAMQPRLSSDFRIPSEPLLPVHGMGGATFYAQIRPRHESVTAIPPIEISYFDPVTGAYRIASSQPIDLVVHPTKEVTLAGETDRDSPPAVPAKDPKEALVAGLAPPPPPPASPAQWRRGRSSLLETLGAAGLAAIFAGPPGVCALVAGVMALRRRDERDPARARRRRAIRRARKRLALAGRCSGERLADAASAAMRAAVADLTGLPDEAITDAEAARLVEDLDPAAGARLRVFFDRCDGARFTADKTADNALASDAAELLPAVAAAVRGRA